MARMIRSTFVLAAALALTAPAAARTVESWDVTSNGQACTMLSTFEDDVSVGLIWSPKSGQLGFMATLPRPSAASGQQAVTLGLAFDGDAPYTEWEDLKAKVISASSSDAVIGNWGAQYSDELAQSVAAAKHVSVKIAGRTIGTYDLAGSPAAYRALTSCGSQLAAK